MKSRKTAPFEEEKSDISSRQCTGLQTNHELGYELLPHPPYSPDLGLSDFFLFADLKI
jgi:hypothetical protein